MALLVDDVLYQHGSAGDRRGRGRPNITGGRRSRWSSVPACWVRRAHHRPPRADEGLQVPLTMEVIYWLPKTVAGKIL